MKHLPLLILLASTPVYATDIKPTFTTEQAQVILNLSQAEMKVAVGSGNYQALKQLTPIVEEILRAAQTAAAPPPAGDAK
jgi:hypothetical protein